MPFDHYVSQAFMKFWSTRNHQGDWDRKVQCFDFETKTLERIHTGSLFGAEGLNSAETELRVGQVIESPLARFIPYANEVHAQQGRPGKVLVTDQERIRAMSIAFIVQMARGLDGITAHGQAATARILSVPNVTLDKLGEAFREQNQLATFALRGDDFLFLPEHGWFPYPLFSKKIGPVWGCAIPLNPQLALIATPRSIEPGTATDSSQIGNFSIGLTSRRVLVPPKAVASGGDLVTALIGLREYAVEMREHVNKARMLVAKGRAIAGLPPVKTMAGDFW